MWSCEKESRHRNPARQKMAMFGDVVIFDRCPPPPAHIGSYRRVVKVTDAASVSCVKLHSVLRGSQSLAAAYVFNLPGHLTTLIIKVIPAGVHLNALLLLKS